MYHTSCIKIEDDLKNGDDLKNEEDLKNWPSPPLKNYRIFFMTSHRDSHTTTDVKPEIIPGVQTGNWIPHDKYDVRGIANVRTDRKDDIVMHLQYNLCRTSSSMLYISSTVTILGVAAKDFHKD